MTGPVVASPVRSRFLNLTELAPFAHMKFTPRLRVDGPYSGRHFSRRHGGSGEFVDYREYSPGEDLRRLDWPVLARTGRAYLRQYQDETNLLCQLAIDVSGSMAFGNDLPVMEKTQEFTGSKLEYVQFLATVLSWLICQGQDQAGLAVLGSSLRDYLPPGGTPLQLARLHELIEQLRTEPSTTMAAGLRELFERSRRRHVLILCSDFLMEDVDEVFSVLRLFRHRRNEVIALHLVHPFEEFLPDGTAFRFEGLEGEGTINCSPTQLQDAYHQRFEAHATLIRTHALASGCDYRRLNTGRSWKTSIVQFLQDRNTPARSQAYGR